MTCAGGWPHRINADIDACNAPLTGGCVARVAGQFGGLHLMEPHDGVHGMSGTVPTLVDLSAIWRGACNGKSSWLAGTGDDDGFRSLHPVLPSLHASNGALWRTIFDETRSGGEPMGEPLEAWDETHPRAGVSRNRGLRPQRPMDLGGKC